MSFSTAAAGVDLHDSALFTLRLENSSAGLSKSSVLATREPINGGAEEEQPVPLATGQES